MLVEPKSKQTEPKPMSSQSLIFSRNEFMRSRNGSTNPRFFFQEKSLLFYFFCNINVYHIFFKKSVFVVRSHELVLELRFSHIFRI